MLAAATTVLAFVFVCAALAAPSMTRIPRVTGLQVAKAYGLLHEAGLRVSVPPVDLRFIVDAPDHVIAVSPPVGEPVRVGSVVSLTLGCPRCGAGSPGVPDHLRRYRVPAFVGRRLLSAYQWVSRRDLFYEFHLDRLIAGNAASFFENYRVTRQNPHAGQHLALGDGTRCCGGTKGSFTPTPLVVWASTRSLREQTAALYRNGLRRLQTSATDALPAS